MECYNSVKKVDLRGVVYKDMVFDQRIVKVGKMEQINQNRGIPETKSKEESEKRAIRRAKTSIVDYVKTNVDLGNFVTYTLDPKKIDRYDEKEIYKRMRNWLSDRVKRNELKYILVPELHKDKAWHFHGFTNIDLKWSYGFYKTRKVDRLGNRDLDNMINYTISYVKKDMIKFNGRRYLHSKNLEEPIRIYGNVSFEEAKGKLIELEDLKVRMKIQS